MEVEKSHLLPAGFRILASSMLSLGDAKFLPEVVSSATRLTRTAVFAFHAFTFVAHVGFQDLGRRQREYFALSNK